MRISITQSPQKKCLIKNTLYWVYLLAAYLLGALLQPTHAASIAEFTQGMQAYHGFFDFYWDEKQGKIWLKIDKLESEFLYINALQTGVGSNDIGLDRGQLGDKRLVKFTQAGPKIFLIQPNLKYRGLSDNPLERKSVNDAFAQSVLWGFTAEIIEAHQILIDATAFLLRDSHAISTRLAETKQGNYQLDETRSAIYLPATRNFSDNSEFEAIITLTGSSPGEHISAVTPTADTVSVRTHHSLVRLPDANYTPRAYEPRSGAIFISYFDYAAPLGQPMEKKWVTRHRLQKKHPEQNISDPIKPIIYYLDPGTPEPVRSALLQGASWWQKAFEAIGFSNAFQIKMLPEDADPLDVRYNTIQWVHRATRGWSYGDSIVDPRSGEIIKGHVTLGSLRVRQDMMIAQGLLSPFKKNATTTAQIEAMALARMRQLSAHEVGHTLGIIHNFYASTQNRASVMDYPHPLIKLTANDELDLSDAYSTGVGAWDYAAIAYLYSEFTDRAEEPAELQKIITTAQAKNLYFISDNDARSPGGSHPAAHLWDNGRDPVQALEDILKVRAKALAHFDASAIPQGTELFYLEQVFVPIYLLHRYQTEAVVKLIAGVDYHYAVRGEANAQNKLVPAAKQQQALHALLKSIQVKQLMIPESILQILLPPPEGSSRGREHFKLRTGLNFDPLAAAETAARHVIHLLLNPERAARLIEHHARQPAIPGLADIIQQLFDQSWKNLPAQNAYQNEVQHSINWVLLQELMHTASDAQASPQVRAIIHYKLKQLTGTLKQNRRQQPATEFAFTDQIMRDIDAFLQNGQPSLKSQPLPTPPGAPIGDMPEL